MPHKLHSVRQGSSGISSCNCRLFHSISLHLCRRRRRRLLLPLLGRFVSQRGKKEKKRPAVELSARLDGFNWELGTGNGDLLSLVMRAWVQMKRLPEGVSCCIFKIQDTMSGKLFEYIFYFFSRMSTHQMESARSTFLHLIFAFKSKSKRKLKLKVKQSTFVYFQ